MLGNYSILDIYLVLVKPTTGMRKVLFLWEKMMIMNQIT